MEKFIYLGQGGMSLLDYSLKFTKLSKYNPSLVSNTNDEMSCFIMGFSDELMEECHSSIIPDDMNIFRLMVHAQQVEEVRLRRKHRESKSSKPFDSGSSKGSLEIKDKPRFKKRFSNQVPSKFPKALDDSVSNPKTQKESGTSSPSKKPTWRDIGVKV